MCKVYLIHLNKPIAHARHYLGYTASESVEDRLARHRAGNGARLLQEANRLGSSYNIVRTWYCNNPIVARVVEKLLKRRHNSPKLCPICNNRLPITPELLANANVNLQQIDI